MVPDLGLFNSKVWKSKPFPITGMIDMLRPAAERVEGSR